MFQVVGSGFPQQNVPRSKKDEAWGKSSVEAIISMCSFGGVTTSTWRDDIQKYYEYYNGIVDESDYTHVLRPYGRDRGNFPAKLHNYPIIKPNVDLLIGEFTKRPRNYSVTVANPDVVTVKAQAKKKKINENLQQHFVKMLEEEGIIPPDGEGEPEPPAHVEAEFERNYRDSRAVMGQNALNFVEFYNKLKMLFRGAWKDFLISGLVFSEKGACEGELIYEIGNPIDFDYDKSPDTEFIEDGDWAARRKMCHLSKVLDAYWYCLTKDEVTRLQRPATEELPLIHRDRDQHRTGYGRMIEVVKVYWKSIKRIGICKGYHELTGEEEEWIVEDDYEKGAGETIDWFYVNEVWEGTRIDGNIYKNVRPCAVQRTSPDNPAKCKLPINGRKYSARNAPNISLVALGIPLQITYNIYKYRLENEVAKAKGMIALLDIDMIPDEFGNGEDAIDKFFYYIEALGIAFQRRAREGENIPNSYQSAMDLTIKSIESHLALLESILIEWDSISGVSRQRKGAMTQYDGKGVTEQSIFQSALITEDYFESFEEFIESEYTGLLDYSKVAFIGSKKAQYVLPDGRDAYLDIDGLQHMEAEYGVFVLGSGKENRKLEGLRQFGQQLATAGAAPLSIVARLMEAENFIQIREQIDQIEKLAAQRDEMQKTAEQDLKMMEMQQAERRMAFEAEQKDLDRQNKVQVALITSKSESGEGEGQEYLDYQVKLKEHKDKMKVENRKLDLQRDKQRDDARLKEKEIQVKRIAASKKPAASR